MNKLTLLVLLDAFRTDYLPKTRFLRELADRCALGELREGFGFVPRASYFGGLSVGEFGFTNMYCFDPTGSPFSIGRFLPSGKESANVERQLGIRGFVESQARENATPYASAYVSSLEMPLPYLPSFDPVEKYPPWDDNAGYHSLFAMLDEQGLPWYQCAWPLTNRMSDHSDAAIVDEALKHIRTDHRFAFVHLQELDGIGHVFGPGSAELNTALRNTDRLMECLVTQLRSRFDEVNLIVFGDHGMVNVTRTVDVWKVLDATGLTFGVDFTFFLDSTMVRFWFHSHRARTIVRDAFSSTAGGRILDENDLVHYGIKDCNPKNAELIFLADPGVLIFPNFFQRNGEPIKGMHGYDPDCADNLGFFLLDVPSRPQLAGTRLGRIDAPEIFHVLCDLLELHPERPSKHGSLIGRATQVSAPAYTQHPDRRADERVAADLAHIVGSIRKSIGDPRAIVLTGSFGRGEGGVRSGQGDTFTALNDYDIIVVDDRDWTAELRALEGTLKGDCSLDYLDLGYSDGEWESLPCTMFNYDLKYGSRVLFGDPHVLDSIPAFASTDIPPVEGLVLLLNRSAGILTGLRGKHFDGVGPTNAEQQYLTNQCVKAVVAMADWHLLRWGAYDASYKTRWTRFLSLAVGAGVSSDLITLADWAFQSKLFPDQAETIDALENLQRLCAHLTAAIIDSCNVVTNRAAGSLSGSLDNFVEIGSDGQAPSGNGHDNVDPILKEQLKHQSASRSSVTSAVYGSIPLLLNAVADRTTGPEMFRLACLRLQTCFNNVPSSPMTFERWESVRERVIGVWFSLIHRSV